MPQNYIFSFHDIRDLRFSQKEVLAGRGPLSILDLTLRAFSPITVEFLEALGQIALDPWT